MNSDPIFETKRLMIRRLVQADFSALHSLCSDATVMKYVGNLKPYKEPQSRQVILKCLRNYEWYGYGGWALIHKQEEKWAGYGGFEFVREREIPELFYILFPSYWGQGIASEFAAGAVDFGFNSLQMQRIGTSFDPANEASMKVARKVGFSYSHEGFDEFKLPTIYYEIARKQV